MRGVTVAGVRSLVAARERYEGHTRGMGERAAVLVVSATLASVVLLADGDGELDDEELRIAVTAMGVPPTWEFLKGIKDLAPKGRGVSVELVRVHLPGGGGDARRRRIFDVSTHHFVWLLNPCGYHCGVYSPAACLVLPCIE